MRDPADSASRPERHAAASRARKAAARREWVQGSRGGPDQAARRPAGEGSPDEVSFRVTVPCTRAQGEAIGDMDDLPGFGDPPPVLVADEPDESTPDDWLIHAYFEREPTSEEIALLTSLGSGPPRV